MNDTQVLHETQPRKSNLQTALELARFHIPVFPCGPDKRPLTLNGFKAASTDDRQIRRWWGLRPDALIGTPTGIKFDVLDIDTAKHPEALEWLEKANLPTTRIHRTRSGGLHYLFQPNRDLTNTVSKLAVGVDTRVKGGYVIWWPASGFPVQNEDLLAAWPEHLLEKLKPVARTAYANNICWRPSPRFDFAQIKGAVGFAASAPEGMRDRSTFWAACRLVEMAGAGAIALEDAEELIIAAAVENGLGAAIGAKKFQSALRRIAGAQP
jgi:hypothetical protein